MTDTHVAGFLDGVVFTTLLFIVGITIVSHFNNAARIADLRSVIVSMDERCQAGPQTGADR